MKLNDISNNPGAHKRKAKVGRGSSSGLGKTCGRGVKGAKARTGTKVYGFEGGQMPLYMRLPKRGFKNIFANKFAEVRLDRIQKAIDAKKLDASAKVNEEALRKAGLAHTSADGIRLIGGGLTAKLEVEVAGASSGAAAAIAAAGGTLTTTFKKKVYMNKSGKPGKKAERRAKSAETRAARQPG
ncbi:MAG: 50S ribosomal protein L15 [Rhizomicrobium sp.]|jgi:large subunit ribosomal protein L15